MSSAESSDELNGTYRADKWQ